MSRRKKHYKLFIAVLPLILMLIGVGAYIYFSRDIGVVTASTEEDMVYEGSIDKAGELLNSGDEVIVSLKVKNITKNKKGKIEGKLICDGESKPLGKSNFSIETLEPNEEGSVQWKIKCKSGGTRFIVQVKEPNKGVKNIKLGRITVSGKGWFMGDNHTHSNYSDGNGSVAENIWAMRSAGLNYMTMTDHNNSNGYEESKSAKGNGEIIIKGNEYTTSSGHAVLMNVKDNKNYGSLSKDNLIKELGNYNTLIYAAHPADSKLGWKFPDYNGVNGIEVWNGCRGPKNKYNNDAFIIWDKLNTEGKHLYGVAETDAHYPVDIGKVYLKTYSESFTEEGIIEAQKKGHMYGTNGPSLEIKVNNAMMGDDYKVNSMGEVIKVNLKGEYYNGISKVRLIRNGEVISEKDIDDTTFEMVERVRVVPGDFIRMEVEGKEEEGQSLSTEVGVRNAAPFAFSNPIFIIKK